MAADMLEMVKEWVAAAWPKCRELDGHENPVEVSQGLAGSLFGTIIPLPGSSKAMKKDSDLIRSNYGELQSAVLTLPSEVGLSELS